MNANEMVREKLGELAVAFGLLTRFPVPRLLLPAAGARSDAVWAYPLVGATVGALGGGVYWLAHVLSLPPAFAALCALAVMIIATGAMHEDGIADFADGLAGRTREQRLAIMRDHQIGTYGVIALMLTLAMRATAIALIAEPRAVVGGADRGRCREPPQRGPAHGGAAARAHRRAVGLGRASRTRASLPSLSG